VRATGGLTDTVEQFSESTDTGSGFIFFDEDPASLETTILKAVDVFERDPEAWARLMKRGMQKDFSWKRSAIEYLNLYQSAKEKRTALL
jgi:starch synthase